MIGNFTNQQIESLLEWVSNFTSTKIILIVWKLRMLHRISQRKQVNKYRADKWISIRLLLAFIDIERCVSRVLNFNYRYLENLIFSLSTNFKHHQIKDKEFRINKSFSLSSLIISKQMAKYLNLICHLERILCSKS